MKRIRVLQLGSPTGLYGAERWILALVRHTSANVEMFVGAIKDAPGGTPDICVEAERFGARTQVFEAPGKLSLPAIRALRRFIVENRIDVLHTHGYKTDILGVLAATGLSSLTVTTPHGWSTNAGLKLRLYEALDRLAFRFHDAVVPLSRDLFDELRVLPWVRPRLHLIPNGVDLAEVDDVQGSAPDVTAWRSRGYRVVGYIGQLIRRKAVDTLVRAFANVSGGDVVLFIVGEGTERAALERLAAETGVADRVVFTGYRRDRIELLRGFDIFVLPSVLEGIPRCLLEAMAAGIAVIASDIPGCNDLVSDGETGLTFVPHDVSGLSERLTRLFCDIPLRTRLAANAESRVRHDFSAGGMAHRYEQLYRELLKRAAPGSGRRLESGQIS